ncbi:MAG TPA: HAMP domain-containing sensor histidine kinase [Solirubrobacteraceae bacterium]|jgi:signal transduction histidine kinase|nr:HAMP domain-containing sensor histidine kinase [Solirubrobacteraceae bacterium]
MRRAAANLLARVSAAFDRLPIRTRLALASALLTFVILCGFALVVGSLTVHRIRSDFNTEVAASADDLSSLLHISVIDTSEGRRLVVSPKIDAYPAPEHAVIRVILSTSASVIEHTPHAPELDPPDGRITGLEGGVNVDGYRVESRAEGPLSTGGYVVIQYARPLSDVQPTIARVELLLVLGTLAGSALALLAGATIARRAMQPIATLTATAAEIARTQDSSAAIPQPEADDEVAELARTLQGMLHSLDDAHAETEAMLDRQRRFVADASHELRTPLTSVLANLELLAESLHGDEGDAARSALRSSRRMRRLVADLLLLARSDVGRDTPRQPVDLGQVVLDAAAELGPLSGEHELSIDAHPTVIDGDHDELFRLTLNLIENALRHTPPGTAIRASTGLAGGATTPGGHRYALLTVEDDGPGVAPELAPTLFERFVRGAGDRGGSFGLGLAIVRAVAQSHGGTVELENVTPHGARFVVRLPLASDLNDDGKDHRTPLEPVINQLS